MSDFKLKSDEKKLLDSLEAGEWDSVPQLQSEIRKHGEYAKHTMRKDKRVNIRISSRDLEQLQTLALEDGIPYQTFISSVLHRFLTGKLIESK
ncbi:MAG: antitoxin [Planctomycetes bacterium]|nr:antitoxin [Planctomycetota bacterium]